MHWTRKIMILGFALVIFTGTIGVDVFSHFCKVDGVNYSYILPPDVCREEVESCCHKPEEKVASKFEIKKNCCEEGVSSFRISSDYIQKSVPEMVFAFVVPKAVSCIFCEEIQLACEPSLTAQVTRPPPKTGQEIIILNQVFRI